MLHTPSWPFSTMQLDADWVSAFRSKLTHSSLWACLFTGKESSHYQSWGWEWVSQAYLRCHKDSRRRSHRATAHWSSKRCGRNSVSQWQCGVPATGQQHATWAESQHWRTMIALHCWLNSVILCRNYLSHSTLSKHWCCLCTCLVAEKTHINPAARGRFCVEVDIVASMAAVCDIRMASDICACGSIGTTWRTPASEN